MKKFLKNAGAWFKSAWGWADGKKTLLGTVARLGIMAANAFAPNLMTPDQYNVLILGADIVAGGGALHKISKYTINKKIVN